MKVNELMLGDWVLDTRTNRPLRVNPFMAEFEVPEWQPIPLTPEILEKNGFYRSEIPTRDEIGNYYHRKTAPSSIFVSMSFDDGRDFGNEIKYVHQLQHALRHCGINKEIIV